MLDCVNLLQGVWILLNFLSQRRVASVLDDRKRSIFRLASRTKTTKLSG